MSNWSVFEYAPCSGSVLEHVATPMISRSVSSLLQVAPQLFCLYSLVWHVICGGNIAFAFEMVKAMIKIGVMLFFIVAFSFFCKKTT